MDKGVRNDKPGPDTVTLTVYVIKEADAPTTIEEVDTCTPTFETLWEQFKTPDGKRSLTVGMTNRKLKVSGGTPPNGSANWNGFLVGEKVVIHPKAIGTGKNADFVTVTPEDYEADENIASSEAFVVGFENTTLLGCARTGADNCFWDLLYFQSAVKELIGDETAAPKTIIFRHTYFVITSAGSTLLANTGANKAWKMTWTFSNYKYIYLNDTVATVLTKNTISRAIE